MDNPAFSPALLAPRHWPVWIVLGLMRLVSLLPMPALWLLGLGFGELAARLPSRGQRVARVNLALCFPNLSDAERARLLRRFFRAAAQATLAIGITLWGGRRRLQRLVKFRGREHYDQAVAAGHGVILLAPHFLALEIAGLRLSQEHPVISMYKAAKDAALDWVMRRARGRFGAIMIERDDQLRPLIKRMRAGLPFYYLPDQSPGGADHVYAPFFGVPTATITALGRMARLADAVVIPCYTRQLPFGRGYEVELRAPLAGFPSGDPLADASRMNAAVEDGVRGMPEQYMWTYKRFKDRPPGERSVYGR